MRGGTDEEVLEFIVMNPTLHCCPDVRIQPETVTFEPSNRRVSVSVTALTDDIQELTENVTLMFDISQSGLRTARGDPSQATVSINDTTESECAQWGIRHAEVTGGT